MDSGHRRGKIRIFLTERATIELSSCSRTTPQICDVFSFFFLQGFRFGLDVFTRSDVQFSIDRMMISDMQLSPSGPDPSQISMTPLIYSFICKQ
jgi:hypothetical protein